MSYSKCKHENLVLVGLREFSVWKINEILFGIMSHNDRLSWLPFSMLVCVSVCQLAESFDLEKFKHINVRHKQVSGLHYSSTVCSLISLY